MSRSSLADAPNPPLAATEQPPPPLKGSALRATFWTIFGYGSREFLRFGSSLLLTRLLWPGAYGLMSLTNIFITGLQMFSDIGIGPSIIQNKRGAEPNFLNTAWTLQCLRGFVLSIVACLLAFPMAWFFASPLLAPLILSTSIVPLLSGLYSTALITQNRNLDLRRLTILELTTQATSIAVMISCALLLHWWIGSAVTDFRSTTGLPSFAADLVAEYTHSSLMIATVWSLVVGAITVAILKLVLSHRLLPGIRNRPRWDREVVGQLFGFGRWVFLSTLLTFLAQWADRLIIGKCFSADALGLYALAAIFAAIPTGVVSAIAGRVMLPTYSRVKNSGRNLAEVYGRVRRPVIAAGAILVSGLIALGSDAVSLLYDSRYHEAGSLVPVLALAAWFQILEIANSQALLAVGRVRSMAAGHLTKVIGLAIGMPLGYSLSGGTLLGAVVGLVAADAAKYAVTAVAVSRSGLDGWRSDFCLTAIGGVVILTHTLVIDPVQSNVASAWLGILLAAAALAIAWAPVGWWVSRDFRRGGSGAR